MPADKLPVGTPPGICPKCGSTQPQAYGPCPTCSGVFAPPDYRPPVPVGTICRWCGRRTTIPCMNTRDMEAGDLDCFRALRGAGGGERSAAWLDRRERELADAE